MTYLVKLYFSGGNGLTPTTVELKRRKLVMLKNVRAHPRKLLLVRGIYTEALTAVCGKSDCLNTPFVTQTFHYILGICNHKYTFYYLVYPYLSFIKCIFMS